MGRIRSIKPEFPQSESMGRVSRDARLLFVLLWTVADDSGRTRGASRMLASLLFPYDDDAPKRIDEWLGELEREHCILRYQVGDASFLQVSNWSMHQKIDKPSASKFPPPTEGNDSTLAATAATQQKADSGKPREPSRALANVRERSSLDKDMDKEGDSRRASRLQAVACPSDVNPQIWADWCQLRKSKRAPVSLTVVDGARKEAAKAGLGLEEFLAIWCRRGSQGLEASWLRPSDMSAQPANAFAGAL